MKKFFLHIGILAILVAVFVPFRFAHAEEGWSLIGFAWNNVLSAVLAPFAYLIMTIMGWLLWLAGVLLDWVLKITILDFKENVAGITGINVVWVVVRDIMNLGFIFLLIWEGMKKILGIGGDAKKLVVGIVITSILLNFSLFFTKVIIDASNIATIGFYNSIIEGGKVSKTGETDTAPSMSGAFMGALKVTSIWGKDSLNSVDANVDQTTGTSKRLIVNLFAALIFLIIAISFFAVSAMFIIRYITLIFLMVLSPIAFMQFAFPQLKGRSKEWWDTLMGQCLFGPIYMFMTWATLVLVEKIVPDQGDTASWARLLNDGNKSDIVMIINFTIVIGMIIATISIAKKESTKGSNMIGTATNWLTGAAGGMLMGGVGGALTQTLGRAGNAMANSERLKNSASKGGAWGAVSKLALKTGAGAAKSSFDVRATKASQGLLKQMGGVNFGKADSKNANFQAVLNAKAEAAKKDAELLKQSDRTRRLAKQELESEAFKKRESDEKTKYLASDAYKNSSVYINAVTAEKEKELENKQIQELNDKNKKLYQDIGNLQKAKEKATDSKTKAKFQEQIDNFAKVIEENKKEISKHDKVIKEKNSVIDERTKYEKTWKTEAKSTLLAKSGGNKEEGVDDIYHTRITTFADTYKNKSAGMRWFDSIVVRRSPTTKEDNQIMAEKILKLKEGKKKMKKSELANIDVVDDDDDKKDDKKEGGDEGKEEPKKDTPPATPTT